MVTDQEPRYRLVDADGNVIGSLFVESDGTLKLQEGTSGNDNELSLTTQGVLEVEQLSVAATSIRTNIASLSSIAADNFENVIGQVQRDTLSEISGSQFVPSESGTYSISVAVTILGADGHELQLRVRNVSQNQTVAGNSIAVTESPGFRGLISTTAELDLVSGDSYEIQVTNINGDWGTDQRGQISISRIFSK
jgi:hypothetical protein